MNPEIKNKYKDFINAFYKGVFDEIDAARLSAATIHVFPDGHMETMTDSVVDTTLSRLEDRFGEEREKDLSDVETMTSEQLLEALLDALLTDGAKPAVIVGKEVLNSVW